MLKLIRSDLISTGARQATLEKIPYRNILLQLFGAMLLPILFAMLFYLNLLAWASARINYILIFELDVRTRLDIHQFIEIPSLILGIFSICFWLSINNFWPDAIAPSSYPLAFFVIAMAVLLNPFKIFYFHARWWMIRSFVSRIN